MKRVYRQRRILAVLWIIKDILVFLMGAGAAFGFEGEGDGILLIVPLTVMAAALGWVWRGLVEGGRK